MWSQASIVGSLLIFLQAATGINARHLCITTDGECGEMMTSSCNIEDSKEIGNPGFFASGSGNSEGQPLHCYSLDNSLREVRSRDTLILSPGTHILTDAMAMVVGNLSGISIIGSPSNHSDVIITCADGVGLSFVNVSELTLSGFTVEGCSLSGSKAMVFDHSNEIFPNPVIVDLVGALFLVYCSDLLVENVTLQKNYGFGVIGWNLLGDTRFRRVNLLSNSPKSCTYDFEDHHDIPATQGVGGGAFILYQNFKDSVEGKVMEHSLSFEQGHVANNYGCREGVGLGVVKIFTDVLSYRYLEGAGGLSIIFGQSSYHMNASVNAYTISNNTNLYGSAGMSVFIYEVANRSEVYITNSTFEGNGGTLSNARGVGRQGALSILYYVPVSNMYIDKTLLTKYLHQLPSKVHVKNTVFVNNSAEVGGGLGVFSFSPSQSFVHDQLNVENCSFDSNTAAHGSAIYAIEIDFSGDDSGLIVSLLDVSVTRSRGRSEAVSFNQLNVSLGGSNTFQKNLVTAMSLQSAIVVFSGNSMFRENIGNRGGAVYIKSSLSYVVVKNETSVSFIANEGRIAGGAIYAEFDMNDIIIYDCFLFVEDVNPLCHFFGGGCSTYGIRVDFVNNTAPLGGAIYGSTLYDCPWSNGVHFISSDNRSAHVMAEDIVDNLHKAGTWLHFHPSVVRGNNVINTLPEFIVSQEHDFDLTFTVAPGGHFALNLSAFDHLLQPVPLTILSHILTLNNEDVYTARSSIGATDRYLLVGSDTYTEVPVNIFGQESTSYLVSISSTETSNLVSFDVVVNVKNCSTGFQFTDDPESPRCECEVDEALMDVECNNDGTVTHLYNDWIGFSDSGEYIQHTCILSYCQLDITDVDLSYPDEQCADNRAGILCGGCLPSYSRSLGSARCLNCNHYHNLSLILLFAVMGILLVVVVRFFSITITAGYINGFFFYANIVNIYFSQLVYVWFNPALAIVALINLNFRIETCFYPGMTQLDLVGLTLLFPIYLLAILLVMVLFTEYLSYRLRNLKKRVKHYMRKSSGTVHDTCNSSGTVATNVHGSNFVQVLVTLLLMSYTSIIQICFDILGFVIIDSPSGRLVRWGSDPNVEYFTGIHIPLFFIAIGLVFILVPIPILLMFPRIILRWRFTNKLKPLIDAITAPFGENRQFWLGFRLLCRSLIYLLVSFRITAYQHILLAVALLFILTLQASIRPYKTMGRNLLDLSLMFNLTLTAVILVFAEPLEEEVRTYTLTAFCAIVVVELLVFILWRIVLKFSFSRKLYNSLTHKLEELAARVLLFYQQKASNSRQGIKDTPRSQSSLQKNNDITHFTVRLESSNSNFLRETLLDETEFAY